MRLLADRIHEHLHVLRRGLLVDAVSEIEDVAGLRAGGGEHFAIVASEYNTRYVDALLRNAQAELKAAGAKRIKVVRVPGAFEIPVVAAALARSHLPRLSAIL